MYIRINGKNIHFDDKKTRNVHKNKKVFQIDDIDVNKTSVSKKNHTAQRMRLNTLSDIMIMMLLDHYV